MSINVPIKPSDEVLTYIQSNWTILPDEGIVLNSKGQEIGYPSERGYIRLTINLGKVKILKRSHVIWWKAKGEWPRFELDHEDTNKINDKIGNLRESDRNQQTQNQSWKLRGAYGTPWQP